MIKKILKYVLLFSFSLATTNQIWHNLNFQKNIQTIIYVALILTIFELFLKPILKILLLPINLLTLGSLRFIINTLGLYLAEFLLLDFKVYNIHFEAFSWQGFTIPTQNFNSFWAYFVSSLTIGIIFYIFNIILKKKSS